MKKTLYFLIFFIIIIIFSGCSIFQFKEKTFEEIYKKTKKFNILLENTHYVATKNFSIPFKVYTKQTFAATPGEFIDKISISPISNGASISIYKNYLKFHNFTKSGTYTLTFSHSDNSTSLDIQIIPDKPIDIKIEIPKRTFQASEKIIIPFKLYYIDKYDNKIIFPFENLSIFPYVKNNIKTSGKGSYELELFNITKPGKYVFSLNIDDKIKKNINFEIIPNVPYKIKFEKNIIDLATYFKDTIHFPPKNSKIQYTSYDKFDNPAESSNITFKIIPETLLTPNISIKEHSINISSNAYPGKFKIYFYHQNKKLEGSLIVNIHSVPRNVIIIDKKIDNNLFISFYVQDGNTNLSQNIDINKIVIKTNERILLINNSLKKYLKIKDNLYILENFPLKKYPDNLEIIFYIQSKIFNYTKKITKKIY
ncbi:hypothetical protein JCM30566_06820 [Marinitoga arctica]